MLLPKCIRKALVHGRRIDYVATYLGPWAHQRNEITRAGGSDLKRERSRLSRIRKRVDAAYR